jgi:hypothetical protein
MKLLATGILFLCIASGIRAQSQNLGFCNDATIGKSNKFIIIVN